MDTKHPMITRDEALAIVAELGKKLVDYRDYPLRQHAGNKAVRAVADRRVLRARAAYAAIRDGADPRAQLAALAQAISGIEGNMLLRRLERSQS